MKTLYFGFALDREKESLVICTLRDSHSEAVEETAAVAGNRLQKVIASTNIAADLHGWLLSNGIEEREARHLLKEFGDGIRRGVKS